VDGLLGLGRRKVGGVPCVVGKTGEWLVVATATETQWRKQPK
jgi:hypothetical protein